MYKNWKAICEVSNPWLRMLIATSSDQEELEGISRAFPELFSEEELVLKVPFSAIKTKAYEIQEESGSGVLMSQVLLPFSIPSIEFGAIGDPGLPDKVPVEWRKMIGELNIEGVGYDILYAEYLSDASPRFVELLEEDYWVAEISHYDPQNGTVDWVSLVPAKFIDFTS